MFTKLDSYHSRENNIPANVKRNGASGSVIKNIEQFTMCCIYQIIVTFYHRNELIVNGVVKNEL